MGEKDITNIKTLKFLDKDIDVQDDIILVFELLQKDEYITGKICRLYDAALGRFTDRNCL